MPSSEDCRAPRQLSAALLRWFDENRRSLPFRQQPVPYHIWLSEIMLQQTRMTAVLPYYERFLAACPDIPALAACEEQKLQKLWEGLGYYSRVRNLQKAARVVCEKYGGELPADYDALLSLPGIGPYTAGAIASISFGLPVPAVDGNVLRVLSRLDDDRRCVSEPAVKADLTARALALQPREAPGDFNQALMELGALVCLPNGAPLCGSCPWHGACLAEQRGTAQQLPVKAAPKARRLQRVTVCLVRGSRGWLLTKRPEKGLLAGLWQPLVWEENPPETEEALAAAAEARGVPLRRETLRRLPDAKHVFTHIEWQLRIYAAEAQAETAPAGCVWADAGALRTEYALPNAFRTCREEMLRGESS